MRQPDGVHCRQPVEGEHAHLRVRDELDVVLRVHRVQVEDLLERVGGADEAALLQGVGKMLPGERPEG